MNVSDTAKVQRYLRQRFSNHKLTLARRENKDDSADLMLEDEFIGVVFRDDEDGETVKMRLTNVNSNEFGNFSVNNNRNDCDSTPEVSSVGTMDTTWSVPSDVKLLPQESWASAAVASGAGSRLGQTDPM